MNTTTRFLFLAFAVLTFSACKQNNSVIIKGDIKGLNTDFIYLSKTYPIGSEPFDSAKVNSGKFEFNIHPDTTMEPDLVKLTYNRDGKQEVLFVTSKDARMTTHGLNSYDSFMIEPGTIELKGDLSKPNAKTMLTGGVQNKFYFKNSDLPYKRISIDTIQSKAQAASINKLIKETPNTYYGLFAMGNLRYSFDHKTLESFYNNFSNDVKASTKGRSLKRFIDDQPPGKDIFIQSRLTDQHDKLLPVLDSAKKLNIVVFWASWCGPCRQEIPSLKKIYNQLPAKDVRIVSISVDDNKNDWETAMAQEKMPWQQLLIQPAEKYRADSRYNLGFIPQIYIVDQHNKVVKKIDGYEEGGDKEIIKFIDQYLAKS
ncbi:AhpC/TSA family protein [Mucilaginibacter roseus]|uniref:AhpC/TSA family protein n=1 Tax=Mucilaginibacter roseus TaxID=1528868 RepID=A0ABS8TZK2_9SPHI|nr:TlpA disulfide reductase family protein [Mucilaginibacter roseus]MCD8740301.1 AhpC/TSA family protein [Mucilaginibacter roseus]